MAFKRLQLTTALIRALDWTLNNLSESVTRKSCYCNRTSNKTKDNGFLTIFIVMAHKLMKVRNDS